MKALHRRPLVPSLRKRRPLLMTLAAPAFLLLMTAGTAVVAGAYRDGARAQQDSGRASHVNPRRTAVAYAPGLSDRMRLMNPQPATRRWPAEIEQLLSSVPPLDEGGSGVPPTIETDQRCSRVEDGLAHCVMLECQTAGDQTACFEMVVTARRLREPPDRFGGGGDDQGDDDDSPGAYEDHPLDGPLSAPSLLDTRHPKEQPRAAIPRPTTRF